MMDAWPGPVEGVALARLTAAYHVSAARRWRPPAPTASTLPRRLCRPRRPPLVLQLVSPTRARTHALPSVATLLLTTCTVGLLAKPAEPCCYLVLVVTLGAKRCGAVRSGAKRRCDAEARKVFGTRWDARAPPFYSVNKPASVSIQRPDTASPSDNGHITAGYAGHTLQP